MGAARLRPVRVAVVTAQSPRRYGSNPPESPQVAFSFWRGISAVAGYWIQQCKSLAEAVEWIRRCPNPHKEDGEIEIRQMFELEDFGASEAVEHHRRAEQIAKK